MFFLYTECVIVANFVTIGQAVVEMCICICICVYADNYVILSFS